MDQSIEEMNVKNELIDSTSTCRLEVPNEMPIVSIKKECLVPSKNSVKTEPQEKDIEFAVNAGTSCKMYPSYNVKVETSLPMVKLDCENLKNEITEDPFNTTGGNKVNELINLNICEPKIKIEPTEVEEDIFLGKHFLDTEKDFNLHVSVPNNEVEGKEKHLCSESEDKIKHKMEEQEHNLSSNEVPESSKTSESNYKNELPGRYDQNRKNNKYTCHVCQKIYAQMSHLKDHLRTHTGERPYECHICNKLFNQKAHLDSHLIVHTDKKPYACDVCELVFKRKSELNVHRSIHDGLKPFSCNECKKSFRLKCMLIRHERTHTNEKPFLCDLCNKAFTDKSDLSRHRRCHTDEKPYSCDVCHKLFAQKGYLTAHKKIHTR